MHTSLYLQVFHNGLPCQSNELHASAGIAEAASPHMDIASGCQVVHLVIGSSSMDLFH